MLVVVAGLIVVAGLASPLAAQTALQTASAPASQAAKGAAFVSTSAGGDWSAIATWASQDSAAPTRIPAEGDKVTISGPVTVNAPVTIGSGSEECLVLSRSAKFGDVKLVVAAPLVVRGSVRMGGASQISVQAGCGIEFDGAAGSTPTLAGDPGATIHVYFEGTKDKRCYLRTKPHSAGAPARVVSGNQTNNIAAGYTDFSDLGDNKVFGLTTWCGKDAQKTAMDHCNFTRASLVVKNTSGAYSLSDCIFSQTIEVAYGDQKYTAHFISNSNSLDVTGCSFDHLVWMEKLGDIKSTVFMGVYYTNPYAPPPFYKRWTENLVLVSEPSSGYIKPFPGTMSRCYWICSSKKDNPHIIGIDGKITFDQCIWDVPICEGAIDDAIMMLGGKTDLTAQRCLSLPRLGGAHPKCGTSLGYIGGGPTSFATYDHITIALGQMGGINSDISHGGHEGSIRQMKNNLFFILEGVKGPGQILNTSVPEVMKAANCDYNGRFDCEYGLHKITGTLGEHDVKADPKFVDPTRCLINFWRAQTRSPAGEVEKDMNSALEWIRTNPRRMGEMVDWTFAGFVPTNEALKAASDSDGATKGWIGAMEGNAGAASRPATDTAR